MKLPLHRSVLTVVTLFLVVTVADRVASAEKGSGISADLSKLKDRPEKIDARYTPEGLRQAFAALCKNLRYRALSVQVDQSEFPFLVYGVLEGRCDYRKIRDTLNSMPGYAYGACVTGIRPDASLTVFALNMTPRSEYARARGGDVEQRIMQRLKELADTQR